MEPALALAGEHLSVPERIVVAPEAGIFRPRVLGAVPGTFVERDQPLGTLESLGTTVAVRSPFRGRLMGMIAVDGERLRAGQAVAWLRVA